MANKQNYLERMELNKQRRLAAGLISDQFPEVSGMVIQMTYYRNGVNPILMQRIVNFFPTGYAYFNMECMIKGCVDGGFDLTSVITDMIKKHKKSRKGKLVCSGKIDALASEHASIAYKISIQYNKQHK
jgi:hypothetical protein